LCRHLEHWGYPLIDSQTPSAHLSRMGARPMARREFRRWLEELCVLSPHSDRWSADPELLRR
jgi:leucyl/phenylalanyl-tRNA---protein transferase